MSKLNRRSFLHHTAITVGAIALNGLIARRNLAQENFHRLRAGPGEGGYGPLSPRSTCNTGETLMELPPGFQYTTFGKTGAVMSDGNPTPRAHDGMAAYADESGIRLIRNHEINSGRGQPGVAIGGQGPAYDYSAGGGTTTLIIDPESRMLIRDFVSASGTLHNCAGGPTPWGTWITCEETTQGTDQVFIERLNRHIGGFNKNHGYCFEVPAQSDELAPREPLLAMGRFVHEAIAVDPETGIVYETEDRNPAGFYRFIPNQPGQLSRGGRLQMLAVKDPPEYDTRTGQTMGVELSVAWVDIDDPDPSNASQDASIVFRQGLEKGGAAFNGLEGCWYGDGHIFFTAKSGGDKKLGQVWQYRPSGDSAGALTLLFESPDKTLLTMPDNVCVSPQGSLVVCEDGGARVMHIRGLTRAGKIFDIARDIAGIEARGEFAGATFSPDGQTLFVNMQRPGITYAIWGPWQDGAL